MTDFSLAIPNAGDGGGVHPVKKSWRKSSFSTSNGACIEVATLVDGDVGVRDSKSSVVGPCLRFPSETWTAFLYDIRLADLKRRA
jgi:hypothetical protein